MEGNSFFHILKSEAHSLVMCVYGNKLKNSFKYYDKFNVNSFFKDFIYVFLERGREGEREAEKHQCVVASCVPPTGDLALNPGMCS